MAINLHNSPRETVSSVFISKMASVELIPSPYFLPVRNKFCHLTISYVPPPPLPSLCAQGSTHLSISPQETFIQAPRSPLILSKPVRLSS